MFPHTENYVVKKSPLSYDESYQELLAWSHTQA